MNTNIIILEGARGTGKSTLAFQLRQRLKGATLINFTGFHDDGDRGLEKITDYYLNWLSMLYKMERDNVEQTIICDRIFFSEMVYSKLYKEYNFTNVYDMLVGSLKELKPTILFFTVEDEQELSKRLQRDKVPFANVEESVKETFRQQNEYDRLFSQLQDINVEKINTTNLTAEQVKEIAFSKVCKD